jgi:drug/metabolite transporter (DMT)-like permease
MTRFARNHSIAVAQASAVLLSSALAFVLAKVALREVPPFTMAWLQVTIGTLLLAAYTFGVRRERIPRGLSRAVWLSILWIGIGNFAIVRILFMLALERLPATTHTYLVNFVGFATMLMSAIFLAERPTWMQVAGATIAIAGLKVFFRDTPAPHELTGVLYVAIGVLVLASVNTVARRLATDPRSGVSALLVATIASCFGTLPVTLYGLATDWPPQVEGWTNWSIVGFNAIVAVALATAVWNHILRTLRSYEASILAATSVIYTALFAIPLLDEHLAAHQVGGIGLLLAGVVIVQLRVYGRPA